MCVAVHYTNTYTHLCISSGDRKTQGLTGFGPSRHHAALCVMAAGEGEEERPTDDLCEAAGAADTAVTVRQRKALRVARSLYTGMATLPKRVKGLREDDKEGLRSVCGDPEVLWHQFFADSMGWCLVRTPPPFPCVTLLQPLLPLQAQGVLGPDGKTVPLAAVLRDHPTPDHPSLYTDLLDVFIDWEETDHEAVVAELRELHRSVEDSTDTQKSAGAGAPVRSTKGAGQKKGKKKKGKKKKGGKRKKKSGKGKQQGKEIRSQDVDQRDRLFDRVM